MVVTSGEHRRGGTSNQLSLASRHLTTTGVETPECPGAMMVIVNRDDHVVDATLHNDRGALRQSYSHNATLDKSGFAATTAASKIDPKMVPVSLNGRFRAQSGDV